MEENILATGLICSSRFMNIKILLLALTVLALNTCLAFDQSHLPNPPKDLRKFLSSDEDPHAWERYIRFQNALLYVHGVKNGKDWRVGKLGAYTNDAKGKPVWNRNTAQFWNGAWEEDINGW